MGWFNKIRGILFEEEEEEIPTYPKKTKEEKKNKEEKIVRREHKEKVEEEIPVSHVALEDNESGLDAIRERENSKRRIIRRDDDLIDDEDVEDNVISAMPTMPKFKEDYEAPVKIKERKPIFQNFDEEEFDRLNSHIISNEKKQERVPNYNNEDISMNAARKANNNFSSTTPNKNNYRDPSRYKLDPVGGKKPFSPSPVISPVYGILDKNYKKDDIVDKTDGIKREIIKPINRQEIGAHKEKEVEVEISIDSIRDKAYGAIDEMEKEAIAKIVNDKAIDKENEIELPFVKDEVVEEPIEKELNDDLDIEEVIASQMEKVTPVEEEETPVNKPKRKILDDVEKTSTLQILDDIEKELNSYKPEKEDKKADDSKEEAGDLTLENDLFNLIDSMYEEDEKGEEEDD